MTDDSEFPDLAPIWNYRIGKRTYEGVESYFIIEAYYTKAGELSMWVEKCKPTGESLEELEEDLEYMKIALDYEVIDLDEFENRKE